MKKKYSYVIDKSTYEITRNKSDCNIIWFCWLQGIDKAPDLVRSCYKSIERSTTGTNWVIKVIDETNIYDYVSFPDYIIKKYESGIITRTHFSDLLRMELLIKYGGIWADSTVFMTGAIPEYCYNGDFFTFNHGYRHDDSIVFESWFIYSIPKHPLLLTTRDLIYEYWKRHNFLNEYFLFHLMFTIASEKYIDIWNEVPFYTDLVPHVLSHELFDPFDKERFDEIKRMSVIHKLSNRMDIPNDYKNTYYDYLIRGELI